MKKTYIVKEEDSAKLQGSGDLEVLSTPRLVAYMENTAKDMIKDNSVGFIMEIKHIAPTCIGKSITIDCKIVTNTQKKYVFEISAYDSHEIIATANHTRIIVDGQALMNKANSKQ